MKVVVVGGGIAGLSAAYRLTESGHPGLEVTLLERSDRFGGRYVRSSATAAWSNWGRIPFSHPSPGCRISPAAWVWRTGSSPPHVPIAGPTWSIAGSCIRCPTVF